MRAESKAQRAHREIRAKISDGTYGPGYRLVLGRLADELGVSVVPVREAIRMLEAEGLVTFEHNVGAQVAMLDATEYRHTMETLSIIEGAATALSAPLLTADDLARARELNDRLRESLEHFDPVRFTELNREFHTVLFAPCPNPHISDLVRRGWGRLSQLRESTFAFVPGRAAESVREHDTLIDLIESGADALDIELAAREHRIGTLRAYLGHRLAPIHDTQETA